MESGNSFTYLGYKSPPPVHILSHINPFNDPTIIYWRFVLHLWSLSCFPTKTSSHTCYMVHPFRCSRFDHPNNISEECRSLNCSIYGVFHSHVTSFPLGRYIPLTPYSRKPIAYVTTRIIWVYPFVYWWQPMYQYNDRLTQLFTKYKYILYVYIYIWLWLQCFDPYLGHRQAYIMNLESVVHA
jgi:hypothetical protein